MAGKQSFEDILGGSGEGLKAIADEWLVGQAKERVMPAADVALPQKLGAESPDSTDALTSVSMDLISDGANDPDLDADVEKIKDDLSAGHSTPEPITRRNYKRLLAIGAGAALVLTAVFGPMLSVLDKIDVTGETDIPQLGLDTTTTTEESTTTTTEIPETTTSVISEAPPDTATAVTTPTTIATEHPTTTTVITARPRPTTPITQPAAPATTAATTPKQATATPAPTAPPTTAAPAPPTTEAPPPPLTPTEVAINNAPLSNEDKLLLKRLATQEGYPVLTENPPLSVGVTDWGDIRNMMSKIAAFEDGMFSTRRKTDDASLAAVYQSASQAFKDHVRVGHSDTFTKSIPGAVETFRATRVYCNDLGWVTRYSGAFVSEATNRASGAKTTISYTYNIIVTDTPAGPRIATGGSLHAHDSSFINSCLPL